MIKGKIVEINNDSTRWILGTGHKQSATTAEVKTITLKNHGLGALEGFTLGLFSGGISLGLVGLACGDDPGAPGWLAFTAEQKAVLGFIVGGGIGGTQGCLGGLTSGSKIKFSLSELDVPQWRQILAAKYGAEMANRILNKELWKDMTQEMTVASWGHPKTISRTDNSGVVIERWTYGQGGRWPDLTHLYFENGRLVRWESW